MLVNSPVVDLLGTALKFRRERKICRDVIKSYIKRPVRDFHVVVVQWQQRNVEESVMHVQSCSLLINLLLFLTSSLPSPSPLLKLPWKLKDKPGGHRGISWRWLGWYYGWREWSRTAVRWPQNEWLQLVSIYSSLQNSRLQNKDTFIQLLGS